MSKERNIPDDAVLEAAAAWLVRLQDEQATGDDWLAFEAWLAADGAHAVAYDRIERLSHELDAAAPEIAALAAEAQAQTAHSGRRPRQGPARRRTVTRRAWMGAGAAAAVGLAAVLVLQPRPYSAPWLSQPSTYDAPVGQTRTVQLADGTQVRLNAGSRIAARVDGATRRVQMADGEAVFDVAHDPRRPFLIRVGDQEVRVVGTQFNLRRRDGRLVLTVRRGVVEVRPLDDRGAAPTRVTVGQQLVHLDGAPDSLVRTADAEEAFGWTAGRLVYRDAPLSEVAADLQRRYARPVRVADGQTAQIRLSGVLTLDDEEAVFRRLAAFAPVDVRRTKDGSVVLEKRG